MAERPLLPQDDPKPEARRRALEEARAAWTYGRALQPLATAASVPSADRPTLEWAARVSLVTAATGLNDVKNRIAWLLRAPEGVGESLSAPATVPVDPHDVAAAAAVHAALAERARAVLEPVAPEGLAGPAEAGTSTGTDLVAEAEQRLTAVFAAAAQDPTEGLEALSFGGPRGRPADVADYLALFAAFDPPEPAVAFARDGLTDDLFVRLRVAGPNPEMLTAVDTVPDGFPATLSAGGETAAALAADGRLFLVDYGLLAKLDPTTTPGGVVKKFLSLPRALFGVTGGRLVPVAIQCDPGGPVFGPEDAGWMLAKHVVQVADMNWHEMVAHLGRTHLLVEPFVMATRRQLAPNHPVHRLLAPHFEGTLFINHLARTSLVADHGAVDRTFAGTIQSTRVLALEAIRTLDFAREGLPARVAARRTKAIREYPWRDDALRIWQAIADFVAGYVRLYYPDAATIADDTEIQAWSAVLARPFAGGGIPGFVPPATPEALAETLTLLVFTASAQHAAVNFPQWTDMSHPPMMSGAGWRPAPAAGEQVPAGDLAFFPPLELALVQVNLLHILGGVHYTQLGQYPAEHFGHPAVDADLVPGFQRALEEIGRQITADNATRRFAYTHLLPRLIPQSINI